MAIYIGPENVRIEKDGSGKYNLCFTFSGDEHNHTLSNPIFSFQWDESQNVISFGQAETVIFRPEKYKKKGDKDHFAIIIRPKYVPEIYIQCDDISGYQE
jgi:hypothetical protein